MRELDGFPAEARAEVVQVLHAALRAAQGEWSRFRGVPLRWVVLDGYGYRRVPFRRLVYVEDVRALLRRASEG